MPVPFLPAVIAPFAFARGFAGRPPKGPEEFIITGYRAVSDGYFAALDVPLLAGRVFTDRDRDRSQPVAIVNDTFVRRFFHGDVREALRSRAQLGATPGDDGDPLMDVVGVVGDTKQAFEAATQPTIYVPYLQPPIEYSNLWVIRLDGDGRCSEFTEWWMQHKPPPS